MLAHLKKKGTLERNIRRARREANVPLPEQTSRDTIPLEFIYFLAHDSGREDPHRILTFANHEVLQHISYKKWFGDGTFKKGPNQFFQVYTLHCNINFAYPPFIYFLLPNKTRETYTKMFNILKEGVQQQPNRLLLDNELVVHTAFHEVYPRVVISGCFFHLRQSVQRKVQNLGLKQRLEQDIKFAVLIKSITALAFVPPDQVEALFDNLSKAFPEDEATDQLLFYFKSTYIQRTILRRRRRTAMFPVHFWNHYENALNITAKTTNCLKGWHNSLRALFQASHPSMWTLRGLRKDIAIQ